MPTKVKEKDYRAIAKKRIQRPSEMKRPPRFLVYSRNKKGKTTFGNSAGVQHTLTIDPEGGTSQMTSKNPHVWHVDRWEDIDDVTQFLRHINMCENCPTPHPFRWVCLDGLTKLSNMSLKYVMKLQEERSLDRIPGMVQQRDYGKSGELMKDLLGQYHNMPLGVVFTAQERQMEGYDADEDEDVEGTPSAYVPDLPKGVRGTANSIVDVIGRLYVVRIETPNGIRAERRLWIGESVQYDTGYRSDFVLPDYVRQPTIPKMVSLMRTGKVPAKKTAAKKVAATKS